MAFARKRDTVCPGQQLTHWKVRFWRILLKKSLLVDD
jgi:hypothetical protein